LPLVVGEKRKILLVDDSEICREAIKYQLAGHGYEVIALDSPFGFGAALTREQPDLVLVDAQMPALSGDKLVEIARKNRLCTCPIVILSDRPPRELMELVRACGASGYISKTNNDLELALAVRHYLETPGGAGPTRTDSGDEPVRRRSR
jgi:DNA-binding response OmpR family regulator